MFGIEDILKNVDLGDIMSKFNLGDKEKEEVQKQTVDAINYRASKEKKRGNEGIMEKLFSTSENDDDANSIQKKLEGDLAFNLKNKSGMEGGLIDMIKGEIMSKFLGSATKTAQEKGDEDGKGLMSLFSGDNLVSKLLGGVIGNKLKDLF